MRNIYFKSLAFLLLFASSNIIKAQVEEPITWSFKAIKIEGNKYEISIKASIDKGWHLYSTKLPEGGPIATKFTFTPSSKFKIEGSVKEVSKSIIEHDEIFNMDLSFFAKEATFSQIIELNQIESATIEGSIEYQACFSDKCLLLDKDFSIKIGEEKPANLTSTVDIQVQQDPKIDNVETNQQNNPNKKEQSSLLVFFLVSLGAGIAGLFTPCVFPMIPMTVSFFMDKKGSRLKSIMNALIFGLSIVFIYTLVGLIITLTGKGAGIANQISSHWISNLIFGFLFIAFAFSFFGLFEIILPSSLATKADNQAEKGGYFASFFLALAFVIVSFSCVGIFVGSLLIEATKEIGIRPIIGMFGFSLALAAPFTLFAIFPSLLKNLPKSGGWLNSIKVVFGFVMLAFSLKFLMVVDQRFELNLLGRDVFIAIWISIFGLLGLYLLGKIKFKHDSETKHVGVFRLIITVIVFAFVIYLIPGMFGSPLKAIAGFIPSQSTQNFNLVKIIGEAKVPVKINNAASAICETPKYAEHHKLPADLEGYFDYDQALACARSKNKPLFLDFGGKVCTNCKKMEVDVLSDPRIIEVLQNNYIVVSLYTDDQIELPEKEWITSSYDGKIKKTNGKKNLDLLITRYNTNAIPFYVLVDNNEKSLVDPRGFNTDVDAFLKFLNQGIEEYKKGNK
jgi:thiol:disulfide interchange protein